MPYSNKLRSAIKILADENVDARLVLFLKGTGVDIKYARKDLRNSSLFSLACSEKRVLLTNDRDFSNTVMYKPKNSSGIIVLSIHPPELLKMESILAKFLREYSKSLMAKTFILTEDGVEVNE